MGCGQVHPNLETVHKTAVFHHVVLGEFGVNHPSSGRHPLNVAGVQISRIPSGVGVFHAASQEVGDRFKAAVRVVGSANGLPRTVGHRTHFVQQEKGAHQTAHRHRSTHLEPASFKHRVGGYDGAEGTLHGFTSPNC